MGNVAQVAKALVGRIRAVELVFLRLLSFLSLKVEFHPNLCFPFEQALPCCLLLVLSASF